MTKQNQTPKGAKNEYSIDEWLQEFSAKLNETEQFNDEVFTCLPDFFSSLAELFIDRQQKEAALFCSLVLISGVLPNYKVLYDEDIHEANLFGYLYGAAGSGKGIMKKCKQLLLPIHKEKKARADEAFKKYCQQVNRDKQKKKGGAGILRDDGTAGAEILVNDSAVLPPPDEMLFLPANITKSNIYTLMAANSGRGVMCEPEALTLTTAIKQEHGSFTDLLLQAFHHETFSYSRKSERSIEIEKPAITILLSSTPKHVIHFFNDAENGLYSRFIFYRLSSSAEFRNPFVHKESNLNSVIDSKASVLKKIYNALNKLHETPLYFRFTSRQGQRMVQYLEPILKEYKALFGDDFDAVVKRYGVIFTRIAMILSLFRTSEKEAIEQIEEVVCTEDDFKCTMLFVEALLSETLKVYEMLAGAQKIQEVVHDTLEQKICRQKQCVELYNAGLSLGEIASQVLNNPKLKPTVMRWLKRMGVYKTKK